MRVCVVIPSYDNCRTVAHVVRGARALRLPVLVVDDGSRDGTARVLADLAASDAGITRLTHPRNRGKGAALLTGFAAAAAAGFDHAVTLDSDGQHLPQDIPRLVDAARRRAMAREPAALILGARDLRAVGAGPGSRFGCAFSNFWTWVETSLRLPDTQTGFRCYPLRAVLDLHLQCTGFDFEIEVLVKAAWSGVPVTSVPVTVRYLPPELRVSHLRPVVDFLRIGRLNTRLVIQRLALPAPFLAMLCQRRYRELPLRARLRAGCVELVLSEPGTPARVAASAALGLFMGIAPFWGFQIVFTLLLAHVFDASKTVAVLASNISFPLMIPPILYGSLLIGRAAMGRPSIALPGFDDDVLAVLSYDLQAYLLGSVLLACLVALLGGLLTYVVVSRLRRKRT